jgi:phosphate transport system permease protein
MGTAVHEGTIVDSPRRIRPERTRADRAFRLTATGAGLITLVLLFLIGLFLLLRAVPTFRENGLSFFTTTGWNPAVPHQTGVAALLFGTFVVAAIALVLAVPVSLLTALYLTEYVTVRLRGPLVTVLDLLAAVPSLIYGIWGFFFLQPHLLGVAAWLAGNLGFLPIFETPQGPFFSLSPFMAGVLVALMLTPTATSVMREVFSQTPPGEKEAALALGGSRWRMIRAVVIPFGRGGIVGGSMLALGRAMGESISVAIILSASFSISPNILQTGGNTIGAHIANRFGDADHAHGLPALMGAGLVLYVVTLLVNSGASVIVRRSRSGAGVEI